MQSRPCPNCGRPLPAQATSCGYCGARFQPTGQRSSARPSSSYPPAGPAQPSTARSRPPSSPLPSRPPSPANAPTRPPRAPEGQFRRPTGAVGRSQLPTQPPGGPTLRQRPRSGGPGSPPEPAPRKSNTRLILLLAALVGIIVGATIGVLIFTNKGHSTANTTNNSASVTIVGVVSFTSSGGLQGNYTASLPKGATAASYIQKGPTGKVLDVVVNSAALDFELGLSPYPGPGTYTLLPFQTNPAAGSYNGTVRITKQQSTWSLQSSAQCTVTVTSDTALKAKVQNTSLDEVKGTFTCPTLSPSSGSAASIAVTQGQFDVDALILS